MPWLWSCRSIYLQLTQKCHLPGQYKATNHKFVSYRTRTPFPQASLVIYPFYRPYQSLTLLEYSFWRFWLVLACWLKQAPVDLLENIFLNVWKISCWESLYLSQVKSSQVKSSQVKSSQVKSSQVKLSQVKSSQVDSSRFKWSRVESIHPSINQSVILFNQ